MTIDVEQGIPGIVQQFQGLEDPRCSINRFHPLVSVIVISILGVLAGADGPVAIAQWAQLKIAFLRKHLALPNGIPSHDTIGRVLQALNPRAFQQCFVAWLESLRSTAQEESSKNGHTRPHIAIDGKSLRRSHDRRRGLGPLHLVSAWATDRGISLGQLVTEEKSNEITAIPELLDQLNIEGAVITIDAAGCQTEIAKKIVEAGGDYVLALKGNQETLHEAVGDLMIDHLEDDFARVAVSRVEEEEKRHGRHEQRTYLQLTAPKKLRGASRWTGLKTVGMAIRVTTVGGKQTQEVRYYISSLRRNGKQFARAVRRHWGIENTLHWSLDVTFREDDSRVRGRRIAENLAWLRRIALTLLKQHPGKDSLAMRRRKSGWSDAFLMEVLTGQGT